MFLNREKRNYNRLIKRDVSFGELTGIRYTNSGDMNGNCYELVFDVLEKTITESKKDYYSEPLNIKIYRVSDEDIQKINNYIDDYNLPLWNEFPKTGEIVLDAATPHLSFIFDNSLNDGKKYESYSLSFDLVLPEEGKKIFREFMDYYQKLCKEENKVKEYIEEE